MNTEFVSIELGKLAQKNGMVDGPFGSDLKASEYVVSGVPIIRLQNIKPSMFLEKDTRFITREKATELSRHEYRPGDLVIAKLGDPCGVAAIVPDGFPSGVIVADVVRFRGNPSHVDHRYLCRFLNSTEGQRQVGARAKGTTRQRCNLSDLKSIVVKLPELAHQKRIADILDKADQIRQSRGKLIRETDELIKSAVLQLLSQLPENRVSIEGLLATSPNAIRTGPFGSQLLHSEFTESGIPVLGIDNAVSNRFRWAERRYVSHDKYKELRRYRVFPGDVMITIMGTTGRVCIAPENLPECISTKHLCTITPDRRRLLPEYLWASLLWDPVVRAQATREGKGAIMEGWNMGLVRGLMIKLPSISQQEHFAAFVRKVESLRTKLLAAEAESNQLFGSLAQRAFGGQL